MCSFTIYSDNLLGVQVEILSLLRSSMAEEELEENSHSEINLLISWKTYLKTPRMGISSIRREVRSFQLHPAKTVRTPHSAQSLLFGNFHLFTFLEKEMRNTCVTK